MKKIKIEKIPSVFRHVNLENEVWMGPRVIADEGAMIIVEAGENDGKNDIFDFINGRLGRLVKGDIVPAVLGFRKAPVEFAGVVPRRVRVGDELQLLCESGVVGKISGVFEAWGKPMRVKVLGSIVNDEGKHLNLKSYKMPKVKPIAKKIPIVCFISTRMDSGKTIMACKVTHYFKMRGKKVAAMKPTGVAFSQDPYKLLDNGAAPVLDFLDMGLPSTCGPNGVEVVEATKNILNHVKQTDPDMIVMEFGEGILGEYHVADILMNKNIRDQISFVVLAANDLAGIYGAREILKSYGVGIDCVTGPIANSRVGIDLIKKNFGLLAESNQHDIKKTVSAINKKVFSKKKK